MTLRSKATAVGLSATLLASLVATIAAPAAFAGTSSVTSAGSVPRAGTSANAATFTFAETSAAEWTATSGSPQTLTVTISDANDLNRVHFSGTGVLQAPDSLAASLSVSDHAFTITINGNDPLRIEQMSVTGLKISADDNATLGAIQAVVSGDLAASVVPATATATGTLASALLAGATSATVNVTSACYFDNTSNLVFGNESKAISAATAPGAAQTLTIAATTYAHAAGETVTETVANCQPTVLPGTPGTVVDSLGLALTKGDSPAGLRPGLANIGLPRVELFERDATSIGLLAKGTTITASFDTAGVVFSAPPYASVLSGDCAIAGATAGYGTLSADRTKATWTVTAASSASACDVQISSSVDVSSTAVGANVSMVVTAGSIPVIPASVVVGYINNVITASAASLPTVYIGENDQATGTLVIKEAVAGALTSAGGVNNLVICSDKYSDDMFVRPATAVVTAGDLKFRDPSTLGPAASVVGTLAYVNGGTLNPSLYCQVFPIYTASTVASTIEIREVATATGAANGAHINVPGYEIPGQVIFSIGTQENGSATAATFFDEVPVAVRAFRNSPVVAAASAPALLRGHASQAAGDVTITETSPLQLGYHEGILFRIVPNSLLDLLNPRVFFNTGRDMPLVSTNTESGLTAQFVGFIGKDSFLVGVNQAAQPPVLGKLTVSNIKYSTTADAPLGPVQLEVCTGSYSEFPISFAPDFCTIGNMGGPSLPGLAANPPTSDTYARFDQVVTNAKVVSAVAALNADIAKGVTRTASAFTLSTVIVKNHTYVTVRIKAAGAAPGDIIQIWTKTKTGAWKATTSRYVSADGYAYYFTKTNGWLAYRGYFAGNDTSAAAWSNAVRALGH